MHDLSGFLTIRRMAATQTKPPVKPKPAAHLLLEAVERMIAAADDAKRARKRLRREVAK